MGRKKKTQSETSGGDAQMYQPGRANANVEASSGESTRRSARQKERQAAGSTRRAGLDEDFEYSPSPSRSSGGGAGASPTAKAGKGKNKQESTAALLNRLVTNKKAPTPPAPRGYKKKVPLQKRVTPQQDSYASSSSAPFQGLLTGGFSGQAKQVPKPPKLLPAPQQVQGWYGQPLPLKVEVTEAEGSGQGYAQEGPRKRGRKRKVDAEPMQMAQPPPPMPVSIKSEYGYRVVTVEEVEQQRIRSEQQQQRKRGRQSAATQNVKPRFPFCALCLSNSAPSDYIINHMSCPNEYQRMKRLFSYVHKDLKFPFMPFDLERENVFDYCDLPLCDNCIVLYQDMYDSYAQIETSRDTLKSKVEHMVSKIQRSEKSSGVASQINLIKNSPDPLMNKYANFRKRFSGYKRGETRSESDSSSFLPATIARVRVINQTPKRTTASQTFLTAGHFPPPPPTPPPAPAPTTITPTLPETKGQVVAAISNESSKKVTIVQQPKINSNVKIVKIESQKISTPQSPMKVPVPTSAPKVAEAKSKQPSNVAAAAASTPVKNVPTPSTSSSGKIFQVKPIAATASSNSNTSKPFVASMLTITRTAAGGGNVTLRPKSNGQPFKISPAMVESLAKKLKVGKDQVIVKDEPAEAPSEQEPDGPDPFTSGSKDGGKGQPQKASASAPSNQDGDASSSSASEDTSDTNVFRKHKKLRATPSEDKNESPEKAKDQAPTSEAEPKAETSASARST